MNLAAVRTALSALVTAVTGITSVHWSRRPRGYVGARTALLRLDSVVSQGRDSMVYDYSVTRPLGAELIPTTHGLRSVTWSVRVESQIATDAQDAMSAVLALRDALHLDTTVAALAAVDLGVGSVLMTRDFEVIQDDRELSVVQMDVQLNATATAADAAIGYVEHWGVEGDATCADGVPFTFINEVVP